MTPGMQRALRLTPAFVALALSCGSQDDGTGGGEDASPSAGGSIAPPIPANGGTTTMTGGSGGKPAAGAGGLAVAGSSPTTQTGGASSGFGGSTEMGSGGKSEADAGMAPVEEYELDCGASGVAVESHGPPQNRVNYVILGDGYTEADLDTVYVDHVQAMLGTRFTAALEPYLRYRKFVNICALKVPSRTSGIRETAGDTAFDGYGNDGTRLGYINDRKVNEAIGDLLPSEIEVDWVAVVLNDDHWWNSGGRFMVWSGGHQDAALAAQHEGGHSFQILADEYGGNCVFSGSENNMRINVTMDASDTAGKWSQWLGFDQTPGTGEQGVYEGAQYCNQGAYRPSRESVMNSLWNSSYFNSISLEQAVRVIYDIIDSPIDSATPSTTTAPGVLEVEVIDADVLKIDWSVDGQMVEEDGPPRFETTALTSGTHEVTARVYDDTSWVRGERSDLEDSVSWTITVP